MSINISNRFGPEPGISNPWDAEIIDTDSSESIIIPGDDFLLRASYERLGPDLMLSGNRIIGHIITSQGGHALTNKLLLKFFSDKSNWSLKSIESINTKAQEKQNIKKPLAANV